MPGKSKPNPKPTSKRAKPAQTSGSKPLTGAAIIVECLRMHNVEFVFGYPGGSVLPLFDELYNVHDIRIVQPRHEQGAAHMADGYARVSNKPGVCIATSGPGATNLITGLLTAYMDSVPIVALTGQVPTSLIGNDAFQEADVTGITRSVSKHNFLVKSVDELALSIHEAFHIATTGRPGPVVVDIPKNIQTAIFDGPLNPPIDLPGYAPNYTGNIRQIERAAEMLNNAKRPLFYVGGGAVISGAHEEILKAAEKAEIPVTMTLMGLGAFPASNPLSLGMLGMHGTAYANFAITHCDALISIGARFDDRVTGKVDAFSPNSKKAHIDIDPTSIDKTVKVDIPIVGDVLDVMKKLVPLLKKQDRTEWLKTINDWRKTHKLDTPKNEMSAPTVIKTLHEVTKGNAVIAVDVGQHQMWTALYYGFDRPRRFCVSGGLGTMGYGLPAGIGAQFALPNEEVWTICGDGGFMMNIQELATLASPRNKELKLKVMIVNNGWLGMVRQWQELFHGRRYSQVDISDNPDFVKLGTAFGIKSEACTEYKDIVPAIERARAFDGPYLIDFRVKPEENVYPMVPAGAAVDKMLFYPKQPELL